MRQLRMNFSSQKFHFTDAVNFIAEKFNADQIFTALCGINLDGIAMYAEIAALQYLIIALVLNGNQLFDYFVAVDLLAGAKRN